MRKILTLLCITTMLISNFVLPVHAKEEAFDVNSLLEAFKYSRDSESGTRSFHEDHGIGYELPSAYSAVDEGYVTSIKNQGRTGMCWAFALIGSMESNAIKRGLTNLGTSLDLSEAHLAKNTFRYEVDPLGLNANDSITPRTELEFIDMGYSVVHGLYALVRGMGPVSELQAPFSYDYQEMSDNVMNGTFYHREFTLQNGIIPWMFDEESVKRFVYENGSVACAYRSNGDEYYGYVKSGGMPNHGAQIVGWDDSIDRNLFLPEPASQDGAWLIKNSWGSSGAYFWLSYDSTVSEVMSAEMAPQDAYDYKYYYDVSNNSTEYDTKAGEEVKIANVFKTQKTTSTKTERIHSVAVGFASMNTVYSLQLYKNPTSGNPESGTPLLEEPLQGVKIHRGYYTISLPQSIEVAKGDEIAVVFTIHNRNTNHVASIEISDSFDGYNYTIIETTQPNQSFIKRANQSWKDMHEEDKVIRIHMLTNVETEDVVGTKTLTSQDMHLRDTTLTYTGECLEPMVIIDNAELQEMMDYGIRYENNLNVGIGKVIVYGVNEYEGSQVEMEFEIQPTNFEHPKFNVSYEKEHRETGSQVKPNVHVTYYDRILEEGKHYTITYGPNLYDNESASDGYFTIKGLNEFSGEETYYFDIKSDQYLRRINVMITPANIAIAPMRTEAYIGENILLTVGNLDYDYAFVEWELEGVTFSMSQDTSRTNVYQDLNLHAKFLDRIYFDELLNRYNVLSATTQGTANEEQWNFFQKQLTYAQELVLKADDNDMRNTQALYFLNLAYDNLDNPTNRQNARDYIASKEANPIIWEDYETLSWSTYMYDYELLKAAVEDIDISQEKLDEILARVQASEAQLVRKNDDGVEAIKTQLQNLYHEKKAFNQDLYTLDSYARLEAKLTATEQLLARKDATKEELEEMLQILNEIVLVERGDASSLKLLLDEIASLNRDLYTEDSLVNLDVIYERAQMTYEQRANLTQSQLDDMIVELNDAYESLVEKPTVDELNKTELKAVMDQAYVLMYDGKDYTDESNQQLFDAYGEALSVYENANNQKEIDEALELLEKAIQQLKEKVLLDQVYIDDVSDTSLILIWTPQSEGIMTYRIYNENTNEVIMETSELSYLLTGLTPDTEYTFWVSGVDVNGNEGVRRSVSARTKEKMAAPEKVEHIVAEDKNYKTITLSWNHVKFAEEYDVYVRGYKEDAVFELNQSVNVNTAEMTGLKTGKEYSFYVVARNSLGASAASEIVTAKTSLQGEVILSMEQVSTAKFKLSWNKVDGATRYIIYRKRNDDSFKKVLTLGAKDLEYTTAELPNGDYQFIVKAGRYDSKDRVMTNPSNTVNGKVEEVKPMLSANVQAKQANLYWDKMEGVTHYQVFRKIGSGIYQKIKTITTTSYTAKLTKGKKYYFKVRGYKQYKSGDDLKYNVYTPYSNAKAVTIQ